MILLFWMLGTFVFSGLVIGIVRRNKGDDTIIQIGGWMFYGLIATFIAFQIVQAIDREYIGDDTEHYLYIYSLKNKSDVYGNFFLGSGTVSETEYYYFYYKSNYGYERHKLSTNDVSIVENDNTRPRIVERIRTYKGKYFKWEDKSTEKYIMYVPTGTIIRQFRTY